ncbi:uncharacterized protein LOC135342101 isoform X2 [Halichondria panicea]|uniref:uncharacterized protein LOC135342101 isoform X2 n=1 Tax=Halichondria panicea TaxID=6063 RepID=UPI00312B33F8
MLKCRDQHRQDFTGSSPTIPHSFGRRLNTPSPDQLEQSPCENTHSDFPLASMSQIEGHSKGVAPGSTVEIGYSPYSDMSSRKNSLSQTFEYVTYQEVDAEQRIQFEALLKRESSWRRTFVHKGLVVNLLFLVVMIVSIILGEVLFPLEGVMGVGIPFLNDSDCINSTAGCVSLRIVRAMGVFGFLGGVTNWIAVEMLFRSIPYVIGTGIIAKGYKEIRQTIVNVVVNTLFDPIGIRQYFSSKKKGMRPMLHLETHFASLLDSEVANRIVEMKIDAALKRPEGFILSMMGVDLSELKKTLSRHIRSFITEISPTIVDKMEVSGLQDGVGLQAEVEKILEERVSELSSVKVNQLIAVMIRKHLSWLIVWGNVLGALVGLVAEVITVLVAKNALNVPA